MTPCLRRGRAIFPLAPVGIIAAEGSTHPNQLHTLLDKAALLGCPFPPRPLSLSGFLPDREKSCHFHISILRHAKPLWKSCKPILTSSILRLRAHIQRHCPYCYHDKKMIQDHCADKLADTGQNDRRRSDRHAAKDFSEATQSHKAQRMTFPFEMQTKHAQRLQGFRTRLPLKKCSARHPDRPVQAPVRPEWSHRWRTAFPKQETAA